MTGEWNEGIVSSIINEIIDYHKNKLNWLVFDGPADTNWVENFNTILDDSKMLCNSNGQRIKLPNNITFIFELKDLDMTTPATITRCGVIFMDNNVLTWINL